jgi:putative ABC transport system permease protein
VLVGVLGIVNTLTMSVMERTREIGVLRALGASRWRIRRTMADESLLVSLAGTLSGILAGLGIGVVWVLGMRSDDLPRHVDASAGRHAGLPGGARRRHRRRGGDSWPARRAATTARFR